MTTSTLYFNGLILSMDAQDSNPEAVLTEGETIVAVGREADLRAQMPEGTELVDLQGQTMIPAFIDPHGHFPDSGFIDLFRVNLSSPPLGTCVDMETALRRLRDRAETTPKGEWIMGVAFDNTAIAEARMPTRMELDSASCDHPIWVIHASGHNGVANSMALERQGITAATPDPLGGRFDRDPETGALTGLIEGISAMGPLGDTTFLIDESQFWHGFAASRDEYLSHGVTYGQNAWANAELLCRFDGFPADKDPGFDLTILPIAELEPDLSQGPDAMADLENPHFTLGPRKLFSDGAFQLQTAFLREEYHRPIAPDTPRGVPYAAAEHLTAEVRKLHDLGFQIHCHCNGDAGSDLFLDAVEAAQSANPRTDHRHTIIHGQVLHEDQFERMARLGVTVSFFSAHIYYWGDRHRDTFLGPDRAARLSAAASALRHGIRFTLHNDASVTPTRPIHLAHCAVNRLTATGDMLGEDQKISVLSALRAQTIDAAWQVFQEGRRGSIEAGKLADMTILSRSPLKDPARLLDTKVTKTIRRGKRVFQSSDE
ncbi:amidohydrolase [uncultured Roseobacter sp.]|uniref:amidohydrolase n=1 Tax=uncultured Roseobacter sp. TaxID=114847 RepID=UPI002612E772|nr:amidohydrolase [uncultured Roseobacter sp.]